MKKLLSLILIIVTLLLLCTGCKQQGNDEEPEDKKYDVSIKIVIEGVGEYIFTPDVDEMTVTIPYDGISRKVYIAGYQFPDHPEKNYRESWFMPKFEGSDSFFRFLNFKDLNGDQRDLNKHEIKDRGEYTFFCDAGSRSKRLNYRGVRLKIVIE